MAEVWEVDGEGVVEDILFLLLLLAVRCGEVRLLEMVCRKCLELTCGGAIDGHRRARSGRLCADAKVASKVPWFYQATHLFIDIPSSASGFLYYDENTAEEELCLLLPE